MGDEANSGDSALAQAEVRAAIGALLAPDFGRLEGAARSFGRLAGLTWEDLLQEAFVRALDGTRECPRGVLLVSFLVGAMRSIAWANRKSVAATRMDASNDDAPAPAAASPYYQPIVSDADSLEEEQFRKAQVDRIFELFRDDDDALMWLMARMDAESVVEVQALTGFDAKKMNTVVRRIRRRVAREFPRGVEP